MKNALKRNHPINRKLGRPRMPPSVVVSARVPQALAAWIREWGQGRGGWGRAMAQLAQAARNHLEGRVDLGESWESVRIARIERGDE